MRDRTPKEARNFARATGKLQHCTIPTRVVNFLMWLSKLLRGYLYGDATNIKYHHGRIAVRLEGSCFNWTSTAVHLTIMTRHSKSVVYLALPWQYTQTGLYIVPAINRVPEVILLHDHPQSKLLGIWATGCLVAYCKINAP